MKDKKIQKKEIKPKQIKKSKIKPAKVVSSKKAKAKEIKKKISAPRVVSKKISKPITIKKKTVLPEKKPLQETILEYTSPAKVVTIPKPQEDVVLPPEPAVLPKVFKEKEVVEAKKETVLKKEPTFEVKRPLKPLEIDLPITVKDLSVRIQEKPSTLIKYLIEKQKIFVTINQNLNEDNVIKTLADFGFEYKKRMTNEEVLLQSYVVEPTKKLLSRPPVVTFMGHVDHGKTSLLDAIRSSKIVDKEHGGITQHIGAYKVHTQKGSITFLDTPGHEAFTAMRARGANITDIVILVVAADDGVMPQTVEAINHAKAANAPIVVAINKIDKQNIEVDRVKKQLLEFELTPEEWGGKTVTVGVSAKTGQGIDNLLEMILLEAEMLELKAVYDMPASGVVVEAKLSRGQGPVVTILVQSGTLRVGDNIICGLHYGKIRAMIDDLGGRLEVATPAIPVEILGLSGLPQAGEKFYVLNDEKKLKEIISKREIEARHEKISPLAKHISLEELYSKIQKGEVKELNLILKADVQGSLEAIKESLNKLETKEVGLHILHSGIGLINSSDIILAEASCAIVIGFHVEPDEKAKELSIEKKVEIRTYRIIYELISEIKAAMEGLLAPKIKKTFIARLEVRKVFQLSKSGTVAGCFVQKGKVTRQAQAALTRDGNILFEGDIAALKRFKDDVREVQEGFECGLSLAGFSDFKEGDIIDAFIIEKIARVL